MGSCARRNWHCWASARRSSPASPRSRPQRRTTIPGVPRVAATIIQAIAPTAGLWTMWGQCVGPPMACGANPLVACGQSSLPQPRQAAAHASRRAGWGTRRFNLVARVPFAPSAAAQAPPASAATASASACSVPLHEVSIVYGRALQAISVVLISPSEILGKVGHRAVVEELTEQRPS